MAINDSEISPELKKLIEANPKDVVTGPVIKRIWAMPNPWTFQIKPIRELICKYFDKTEQQKWFDPFAGSNPFRLQYSNDLNPETPSTFHDDAVEFLLNLAKEPRNIGYFDGGLHDPPYTLHQANQVYRGYGLRKPISLTKDLMVPLIKEGGYVLCFGHNSGGMGINRGFKLVEVLLVPHGGSHDDTICTVEQKISQTKDLTNSNSQATDIPARLDTPFLAEDFAAGKKFAVVKKNGKWSIEK